MSHSVFSRNSSSGFSLIEMIIDISILMLLLGIILFLIDPYKQIKKGRDVTRRGDVRAMQHAFDLYYQDHNCFPTPESIPWGQEWSDGGSIYIKRLPTGPNSSKMCTSQTCSEYTYITSADVCPQWYTLFAGTEVRVVANTDKSNSCPLEGLDSCIPANYSSGNYLCVYGGTLDCHAIAGSVLTTPVQPTGPASGGVTTTGATTSTPTSTPTMTAAPAATNTPTATPTTPPLTNTPTPTPTTTPAPTFPSCNPKFACRGNPLRCNSISTPIVGETVYCDASCNGACL